MDHPSYKKGPKHDEEVAALHLSCIAIIDTDKYNGPLLWAQIAWKIHKNMEETERIYQ